MELHPWSLERQGSSQLPTIPKLGADFLMIWHEVALLPDFLVVTTILIWRKTYWRKGNHWEDFQQWLAMKTKPMGV